MESILEFVEWIYPFIFGGGVVPVINWLKSRLGVEGRNALALAAAVSFVAALMSHWLAGELLPGTVTWSNIGAVFLTLFYSSQVLYRGWLNSE